MIDIKEQLKIIKKGTLEIINEEELVEKLKRGKPLVVKLGVDPTAPDIHLGHTVVLNKLRDFQRLGHHVVLIIGSGTAIIGDPSGRDKARSGLTPEQIEKNARYYSKQAFKILDREKTEIRYNGEWLLPLKMKEIVELASHFTIARILERDDFFNRYKKGVPIYLHEFLYPVMQAYDSVVIKADVELGGSDQKFNLLFGRDLQRDMGQEPQVAILMPILRGIDGEKRMGKSLGNYIGIDEPPKDMFGKIMSIPDHLIIEYFELLTDRDPDEIEEFKERMDKGENPRDFKLLLAEEIVSRFHSKEDAKRARDNFIKIFSKREIPEDIPVVKIVEDRINLVEFLKDQNLVSSKSEARRLILQGGVSIDGKKAKPEEIIIDVKNGMIIKVGKRRFLKVVKR